jgi:small conductance mechanosensitive channel
MWQWFIDNSIWILTFSVICIILGLVMREILKRRHRKELTEGKISVLSKLRVAVFWFIEVIAWVLTATSLVTLIMTRQGTVGTITSEIIKIWLVEYGVTIFILLLIGFVLWFALNRFLPPFIMKIVNRPRRGESMQGMKKRADTLAGVFLGIGKITLVIIILFEILSEIGINIAPVLAGFGIVGIAVGFGAQYLVRDLIAGIFVLIENQYRVGDVASIAGFTGTVEMVDLRKTVLRDLDGIVHHIPNGEIKVASNYTRHFSRIKLDMPVSYNTDLEHAMNVINRVGQELAQDNNWKDKILTPPKAIRINNFGNSGIEIRIVGDCKPMEQWTLTGELRLRLKKAFDNEGIEIPWPHTKVYFGNLPSNLSIGDR